MVLLTTGSPHSTFTHGNTWFELYSQWGHLHPKKGSSSLPHPAWVSHVSYLLCPSLDFSFCALLMAVRALEVLNGVKFRQRSWENELEYFR